MLTLIIAISAIAAIGIAALLKGEKLVTAVITLYTFFFIFQFALEKISNANNMAIVIALIASVAACLLAQYAKKAAFFLLGFLVGIVFGDIFIPYITQLFPQVTGYYTVAVHGGIAIVAGALAAVGSDLFIRMGTAFVGAEILTRVILMLVYDRAILVTFASSDIWNTIVSITTHYAQSISDPSTVWFMIGCLILTIVGTVYQEVN